MRLDGLPVANPDRSNQSRERQRQRPAEDAAGENPVGEYTAAKDPAGEDPALALGALMGALLACVGGASRQGAPISELQSS